MRIPGRIELALRVIEESFLNFNYQHDLMGFVYSTLSKVDPVLANDLHSRRSPKNFTFSWLRGKPKEVKEKGIVFERDSRLKFIFSAWDDEIVEMLSLSLLNQGSFKIGNLILDLEKLRYFKRKISSKEKFVLLSPVVVSRPVEKNGKLYHEYLSPKDEEFFKRLADNLKKRFELITGKRKELSIEPDRRYLEKHRTSKLVDIKGTKIRGHIFPMIVEGDTEIVEFGYYAGLGERTSQGFGCVEIVERRSKDDREDL